ncbi:MAG: AAA family ATPase, partial [Planctomycetota bacterium]
MDTAAPASPTTSPSDRADLAREIEAAAADLAAVTDAVSQVVVGQHAMVEGLLIGLLTGGHVLLEGVPGLAKTLTVSTLAGALDASFSRVQFTPDLLPADIVGTLIYSPSDGAFSARPGPIFANIVLADEINRAPAKVQSALLEAMQERQVTLGDDTHR